MLHPDWVAGVPDFFQLETPEARLQQIEWMIRNLDLDAAFFRGAVGLDLKIRPGLSVAPTPLKTDDIRRLERLWDMVLHLLSVARFDNSMATSVLRDAWRGPSPSAAASVPWAGESIRSYVEKRGEAAVNDVTTWLTSLRFTDRYGPRAELTSSSNGPELQVSSDS